MTRLPTSSQNLRPEPARPEPIDGVLPDVQTDVDAEFVVEWQVVDPRETAVTAGPGLAT